MPDAALVKALVLHFEDGRSERVEWPRGVGTKQWNWNEAQLAEIAAVLDGTVSAEDFRAAGRPSPPWSLTIDDCRYDGIVRTTPIYAED